MPDAVDNSRLTPDSQSMALDARRYTHKASPGSSHQQIVRLLGDGAGRTCVDAGCASGYLADQLRKNNWRVIGIEPDARAAAVARESCDALVESPLEDVDFRGLEPYQAVVFGDVLEHLVHPDSVLRSAVQSLDSGGAVVASLPNTAFVLIRMSLLFGRFDYTERGILDETHLRFFTKRSALSLLASSGIAVESARATIPPVELVLTGMWSPAVRPTRTLLRALARIWPAGFGYQFVFSGTKAG